MNSAPYRRLVQYYETDRMGIVHHSNYIRWFEEARTDFLHCAFSGFRFMGKNPRSKHHRSVK